MEGKWKDINDAMNKVYCSEDSLRTIQNGIELDQQKLIGLREKRLSKILERVADLGICETDETAETTETAKISES